MYYLYVRTIMAELRCDKNLLLNTEVLFCYELKSLKLDRRTNSCIGVNTRELDRELFTK